MRAGQSRSADTTTPLPAASPSSLTTQAGSPAAGPKRSRAASRCAGLSTISLAAVRTPAAAMTSLAKDFEPSIRAASLVGPKHAIPAALTASATPSTSGTSGPMTTRSAPIRCASATTASPTSRRRRTGRRLPRCPRCQGRRQARPPRGPCATPATAHVHGLRIRLRGRARSTTLAPTPRPYTSIVYGLYDSAARHTKRWSTDDNAELPTPAPRV